MSEKELKKVLILAYDFPPYVSVGALRPYSWYKYFHEFGLYPIVVTRQWGNKYGNQLDYVAPGESDETIIEETEQGVIIRTPYKPNLSNRLLLKYGRSRFALIRKMITVFYEIAQWYFFVGPKVGLYYGALHYLKKNKVDAIIATGEPFVLFRYANLLSRKYKIPWVADYRDEWLTRLEGWRFFYPIFSYQQDKILKKCTLIISASENYSQNISKILNKEVYTIINGIDSFPNLSSLKEPRRDVFKISYVGTLYDFQPIEEFFDAVNEFLEQRTEAKLLLSFYGLAQDQFQTDRVLKINRNERFDIDVIDKMPKDKMLFEASDSAVFLLLANPDFVTLAAKIFDYIVLNRKIILFRNDNSVLEKIIDDTQSGFKCARKEDCVDFLSNIYSEWKIGNVMSMPSKIEKYSRREQVRLIISILEENILQCIKV